jgi:hypothetical protein
MRKQLHGQTQTLKNGDDNMTRINVGILPKELVDKHLIAEHREIKRIPNCVKKGRYSINGQPDEFKLGKGHVKFFYDKLLYLKRRYKLIYDECISRGFNVTDYISAWDDVPLEMMNDYHPSQHDRELLLERIASKLQK